MQADGSQQLSVGKAFRLLNGYGAPDPKYKPYEKAPE